MRRAVIYARVSSDRQAEEGWSHDAQVERLRAYAEREGLEVVAEVIATESAKASGRKAFREVLALLREPGGPRVLLVEKADRAARNLRDFVELDDLRQGDVEVHSTREGLVIKRDSDPSAELMWNMQAAFARHYVANLSAETKKGMRQARRAGRWTHRAPYGYRNARESGRGILLPHEAEAVEVRRIFTEYDAGGSSVKAISSASPLSNTAVHKALRCPLYAGLVPTDEGLVEGAHEAIVPREVWWRVQARLDRRQRKSEHPSPRLPYGGGLLSCGDCGRSIVAGWSKGRSRLYGYLWCPDGCTGSLPVAEFEGQVADLLGSLVVPEAWREPLVQAVRTAAEVETEGADAERERLRREHDRLNLHAKTAYLDRLDGRLSPKDYDELAADLHQRRAEAAARLESLERASTDWRGKVLKAVEMAFDPKRIWASFASERFKRREMLEAYALNRRIRGRVVELDWREPLETVGVVARTVQHESGPWPPEDTRWLPIANALRTAAA